MTKAELIKFLEPFTDEAVIVLYNAESDDLFEIDLRYQMAKTSYPALGIQRGDGFIVID